MTALTDLIDTGYLLFVNDDGYGTANYADMWLQEAAIQAAIWKVENPGVVTVTMQRRPELPDAFASYVQRAQRSGGLPAAQRPQDKVFTILSQSNSQSFAIGWPIGVPEPTSWALMLTGFLGMGTMLRRQRKAAAATA